MPIQLTTPFNPGDADPGNSYTHLEIKLFTFNAIDEFITMYTAYGTMDGYDGYQTFEVGKASVNKSFSVRGADLQAMVTALPSSANEVVYDGVKRLLYQYLIDKNLFAGTII